MSHIVEAKTTINHPDRSLLRQAVTLVASQHAGAQVGDHYFSYYGQSLSADLTIITDELHRGMEILVKADTGALTFKGDFWGREQEAKAIQQQIIQTYVSLATMQALGQMGYQTTAEDGEDGQVILTGVNQYA